MEKIIGAESLGSVGWIFFDGKVRILNKTNGFYGFEMYAHFVNLAFLPEISAKVEVDV